MAGFFIDRPVFAWVVSLVVMVAGGIAIATLPVERYPTVAPPSVSVFATYPGASARTVDESVTQIIEQSMKGLDGLLYLSANSDSSGRARINLTFDNGTDVDTAQVQVQNKLQLAMPLLPQVVQQQGIRVNKSRTGFLMIVGFVSGNGAMAAADIADYVAANVVDPLSRVPGVGETQVFGTQYAMRIWLDPDALSAYQLTPGDVAAAVQAQNQQVSFGQLGAAPAIESQHLNATITAQGRLQTPEQFRAVVIRSAADGAVLTLGDIARVEMGAENYEFISSFNGQPATGVAISMATGANALETAAAVRAALEQLAPGFPEGLETVVPFDTTPFVDASIEGVIHTLIEAVVLVFLVMLLFLQNLRATLIPTIAVPVVLLGTFGVLAVMGMSINMLTMFAMVLAIGLLVDDAIVVVENVERVMAEQGLGPREATRASMGQITGALVGIGMVLSAVFVPMAFFGGATGIIYRQFSVTIVAAMALSVLVALTLTPALCASLLRPAHTRADDGRGFFAAFNRGLERGSRWYQRGVHGMAARSARFLLVFAVMAVLAGWLFVRLPAAFLPDEDQGFLQLMVQGPVGSTQQQTLDVLEQARNALLDGEAGLVESVFTVQGFSFAGAGQNMGMGFVQLADWSARPGDGNGAAAIAARAQDELGRIPGADVRVVQPPPMPELGTAGGFALFLKDSAGLGHDVLTAARGQLLGLAAQSPLLANVRPNGQDDTPQLRVDIDVGKAAALGVSMDSLNDTLSVAWGGRYIDDFVDRGRVKRVYLQADAPFRMVPGDFRRWSVRNDQGQMVPVASLASSHWESGSPRLERYNGVPAMEIHGEAAAGVSSGEAMAEMERLAAQLADGITLEWTGLSYQEQAAGAQTPLLYALSLLAVFLCLAALYESWSVPTAVLLVAPLGILGTVLAVWGRGLERDIYFQVAMLTTVGLTSKNAILIVEFARANLQSGMELLEATLRAVRDRLRPILMTSLAFGLGVVPLALSSGAGSGAQQAIGTGVLGGMVVGTLLGLVFTPLFFLLVQRLIQRGRLGRDAAAGQSATMAAT